MVNHNKKANTTLATIAIVGVVAGGVYMLATNSEVSNPLSSQNSEQVTQNPDFYISSLSATNTSLFTVTTSGSGKNTEYLIEVDADTLGNSARTETFTVGTTNNLVGAYDDNYRFAQEVFVAPRSDLEMSDTSDDSHVLIDASASTYDSAKVSKVISHQGVTEVTKTYSMSMNPNGVDLGTLVEINDVGEYKSIDLDFGQSNKVTLKIKE